MYLIAALALAYPPLSGDPASAAPLDISTTTLPGASGSRSAARVQVNACRVSACQLRLNVSQVCSGSGAMCGVTPALSTSSPGRCWWITSRARISSVASPASGVNAGPSSPATARRSCSPRAMPTTLLPRATSAAAMARPNPRLAPVTTAVFMGSDIRYSLVAGIWSTSRPAAAAESVTLTAPDV